MWKSQPKTRFFAHDRDLICLREGKSRPMATLEWPGRLRGGQGGVEVGDGLDPAEIVFEGEMFIGGMRVFVGQAEPDQDARNLEGVIHLRHEGNRATLADEHSFFP